MLAGLHVACAFLWHPPCRAAAWMGCCSSWSWVLFVVAGLPPRWLGCCCSRDTLAGHADARARLPCVVMVCLFGAFVSLQDLEEEHLDELKHEAASVPATRIPQQALPELPSAPKTQVGGQAEQLCAGAGGQLCKCTAFC